MRESYIPQHLDVPERIIVFTPDELIVVIIPLGVMTIILNFVVGLAAAAAAFWALRKIKQGGPLSRLVWRVYWVLPEGPLRLRATPPSHLRQLAG